MIGSLLNSPYGILLFDESTKLFDIGLKDLSINQIADQYLAIKNNIITPEFKEMIETLQEKGYHQISFYEPTFIQIFNNTPEIKGEFLNTPQALRAIKQITSEQLKKYNSSFTPQDFYQKSKVLAEYIASKEVSERSTEHDLHIKQSVDMIESMDKNLNSLHERIREWYGLHFPELTDKLLDNHHTFVKFVKVFGDRSNIDKQILMDQFGLSSEHSQLFVEKAERSMGGTLSEADVIILQSLAEQINNFFNIRVELEEYISNTLDEVAPNLKIVLGSQITAKMIATAGSLKRLATMSSSTLQIIGAEKALFKALKAGGNTPKHGILFQWHEIRSAKHYARGKIARMVSGKLSILAKVDYFKGEFVGDRYKENIAKKIAHIMSMPAPKRDAKKPESRGKTGGESRNRGPPRDRDKRNRGQPRDNRKGPQRDNRNKGPQRGNRSRGNQPNKNDNRRRY